MVLILKESYDIASCWQCPSLVMPGDDVVVGKDGYQAHASHYVPMKEALDHPVYD